MKAAGHNAHMIDVDDIRRALIDGEFFLEYLPTVSLLDGRCIGAEALVRWRRGGVVVPPLEFVPIAENTPVIGLLTYWVMDTVAAELREWLRATPDAHVAINVPPEIVGRGGIEYAATRSGLIDVATQVVFELTERGLPDLLALDAINHGRSRGVRVALDDALLQGGANVLVLARANIDIIKLDRTLVAQIAPDTPHPPWLDDMTTLMGVPRLTVIAEGVETLQQQHTLQDAGLRWAQGHWFSRPLEARAFIAYHRASQGGGGEIAAER